MDKEILVKAALAQGKTPRAIADDPEYDITYPTVLKYRNELRAQAEKDNVAKVASMDPVALQAVVENIPDSGDNDIDLDTQSVIAGAAGMQALLPEFQSTASKLLKRIGELADKDSLTPNGVKTLTSAVGDLYSDMFVQKGTNVLVNNNVNNVSSDGMSKFRASQR